MFVLGYVKSINGMCIAKVCNKLGAGRQFSVKEIDPAVGVHLLVKIGDYVQSNAVCMVLHHNKIDLDQSLLTLLFDSIELTNNIVESENMILEVIDCNSS